MRRKAVERGSIPPCPAMRLPVEDGTPGFVAFDKADSYGMTDKKPYGLTEKKWLGEA